MTTPDVNKEFVRRYWKKPFDEERLDISNVLVGEGVVNHDPLSGETLTPEEPRQNAHTEQSVTGAPGPPRARVGNTIGER